MLIINASPQLWTPDLLQLALWLDAADQSTITVVSGGVSEWRDKSGNGRRATQLIAGSRPGYTIGGLNGTNVLTFDGINDHLNHSFNASPAPHSVFAVARRTTGGGAYQAIFTAVAPNSPFGVNISAKADGLADWGTYINNWVGGGASLLNNWSAIGIVSPSATSGSEIFDTNGSTITVSYGSRYSGDGNNRRTIGGDPAFNSGYLRGDIAEIIVIMSALSVSSRQLLIGYLSWKWGLQGNLPANHPFANRPPLISDP